MSKDKPDDFGRRSDDALEIPTPFGPLRARGSLVIIVVLACGLGFFGYLHDERTRENTAAIVQAIVEQSYISLLSEPEKAELRARLAMPDSLQARIGPPQRDIRPADLRRK
jgi:hypothetical protein